MSDDSQIDIAPSFVALFVLPGRQKPSEPRAVVAQRYEFCEDLATLLTETACDMMFKLGITQHDVLQRVHQGLLGDGSVVSEPEAQWVIQRLDELMG